MNEMLRPYARYFELKGRSSRLEFWSYLAFNAVVGGVLGMVQYALWGRTWSPGPLETAFIGLSFVPAVTLAIRRLHDTNRTGWWYLLSAVPVIGQIILVIFFLLPGTRGPNRFDGKRERRATARSPVLNMTEAPRSTIDDLNRIERLGALRDKGLLTEAEFQSEKAKLLPAATSSQIEIFVPSIPPHSRRRAPDPVAITIIVATMVTAVGAAVFLLRSPGPFRSLIGDGVAAAMAPASTDQIGGHPVKSRMPTSRTAYVSVPPAAQLKASTAAGYRRFSKLYSEGGMAGLQEGVEECYRRSKGSRSALVQCLQLDYFAHDVDATFVESLAKNPAAEAELRNPYFSDEPFAQRRKEYTSAISGVSGDEFSKSLQLYANKSIEHAQSAGHYP